ncbi:MAG: hypothetical protein GY861_19660 [bacterium]|nr:hypothetical protein [bacterium]
MLKKAIIFAVLFEVILLGGSYYLQDNPIMGITASFPPPLEYLAGAFVVGLLVGLFAHKKGGSKVSGVSDKKLKL